MSSRRNEVQVEETVWSLQIIPRGSVCSGKRWMRDLEYQAGTEVEEPKEPTAYKVPEFCLEDEYVVWQLATVTNKDPETHSRALC